MSWSPSNHWFLSLPCAVSCQSGRIPPRKKKYCTQPRPEEHICETWLWTLSCDWLLSVPGRPQPPHVLPLPPSCWYKHHSIIFGFFKMVYNQELIKRFKVKGKLYRPVYLYPLHIKSNQIKLPIQITNIFILVVLPGNISAPMKNV